MYTTNSFRPSVGEHSVGYFWNCSVKTRRGGQLTRALALMKGSRSRPYAAPRSPSPAGPGFPPRLSYRQLTDRLRARGATRAATASGRRRNQIRHAGWNRPRLLARDQVSAPAILQPLPSRSLRTRSETGSSPMGVGASDFYHLCDRSMRPT